jgi:NAD dependent epimerase/dehydratase family
MSKAKRTALVTGASGLAGSYMLAHLLEQGGWDIVAVSRRKPRIPGNYRHIAVDLLDPADCQAKLGPLPDISHLFYLAITSARIPLGRYRRMRTCSSTSSRPSRPLHPCLNMFISLRARGGTAITSVPTRLRPRKTIRGTCRPISITTSRTFLKNSRMESAGRGRSGVRTRSADSPREDR